MAVARYTHINNRDKFVMWPFRFLNGRVMAVSLLKPPCGGFKSETATWIKKWLKKSVGASKKLHRCRYNR